MQKNSLDGQSQTAVRSLVPLVELRNDTGEKILHSYDFKSETFQKMTDPDLSHCQPHEIPSDGWRTYNFEVAHHHTYIADNVRVHNTSMEYTLNADGTIATLTSPLGENIKVQGSWTPSQAYHYGKVIDVDNGDGTTSPTLTSGTFAEGLSAFGRSFADAIGLDGRFGLQGTFALPDEGINGPLHETGEPNPYRVDWSGDADRDLVPDYRDEDYSNIGHWDGDRDGDGVPNWQDRNDGVGWRDTNPGGEGDTSGSGKPIILDLDGDGIEIDVNSTVSFDMDADGFLESTAWVSPDDAFLVIDLNADGSRGQGDGQIRFTHELAFSEWLPTGGVTDLQALSMFDTLAGLGGNGDGALSSADTVWTELRVWQDANSNGVADSGELHTLHDLGITQVNLIYDDGTAYDDNRNDVTVLNNTLFGTASFTRNGAVVEGGVGDVSLSFNTLGRREIVTETGITEIQFENGFVQRYANLADFDQQNIILRNHGLDGATGDDLDNILDAANMTRAVQISAGAGNDTVSGGAGDDFLSGGAGADELFGGDGNDYIILDGDDLANGMVDAGRGFDVVVSTDTTGISVDLTIINAEAFVGSNLDDFNTAHDRVTSGTSQEDLRLSGGAGRDTLEGAQGNDVLDGGNGNDSLRGGSADDRIDAGNGRDTLSGEDGDDHLSGGDGRDDIDGGEGDDYLNGGDGRDTLVGGEGDDQILGSKGGDLLRGGNGDDRLYGGNGEDTLQFWFGDDTLNGGNGDDVFQLIKLSDDAANFWGHVVIQGGEGYDVLYVSRDKSSDVEVTVDSEGYTQWALEIHTNSDNRIVMDLQDIEEVQWSDGTVDLLSTDTSSDTTDQYVRTSLHQWMSDGGAQFSNGAYRSWAGNDHVVASGGNDFVVGSSGADQLEAYNGNDTIWSGGGNDTAWGGAGNDTVTGSSGSDVLLGGDGHDTLHGASGADELYGHSGNDSLRGDGGNDLIFGGTGTDSLIGNEGHDVLVGDEGNDTLLGGTGSDQLSGGDGDDEVYGEWGTDTLYGDAGADSLFGGIGLDVLYGGEGNDSLDGDDGGDELYGGDGMDTISGGYDDDHIEGGAGSDSLDGGLGTKDILSYASSDVAVTVNLETNVVSGGHAGGDTINGFEGAIGSIYNDSISGTQYDNAMFGLDGNDTLIGADGFDDIDGGSGDDSLEGGSGLDWLFGGLGDDRIISGTGNDYATGGDGVDLINGNEGDDYLQGDDGDDSLWGNQQDDTLDGGDGEDYLNGGYENDHLLGGRGIDRIVGSKGNDSLVGGDGADIFIFNATSSNLGNDTITDFEVGLDKLNFASLSFNDLSFSSTADGLVIDYSEGSVLLSGIGTNDIDAGDITTLGIGNSSVQDVRLQGSSDAVFGFGGSDSYRGGYGEDIISGGSGNDSLWGNQDNDVLSGGEGNDHLDGGFDDDYIAGGLGSDRIIGNRGNDFLVGGEDADVFVFDIATGGLGNDTISDFDIGLDAIEIKRGEYADLTFTATNEGLLILHSNGSILLEGSYGDFLNEEDFIFI